MEQTSEYKSNLLHHLPVGIIQTEKSAICCPSLLTQMIYFIGNRCSQHAIDMYMSVLCCRFEPLPAKLPWQLSWQPRLQNAQTAECRGFESHLRAASFFPCEKNLSWVQLNCLLCLCLSTSYLIVFTYIPVRDLYRFLCMLYMIDRRPVIVSALYLSIHSVFVDVMFHIHSANHRNRSKCTSGLLHHNEQWFVLLFCFWFHQLTFTMLMHTFHF